jgi:hypothetical protein
VRTAKRRSQADLDRRNRLILYGSAGIGIVGLAIALILVFAVGRGGVGAAHDDGPNVDLINLPGIMRTPPPWSRNDHHLTGRLKPSGLSALGAEGQVLHIHQHLDIYDNGKHITVPQFIGIHFQGRRPIYLTELHTHRTDGVIHLESLQAHAYSLGQFFGSWGLYLSRRCIGGLCAKPGTPLRFYVNGRIFRGNPVKLVLQQHQEIAIVYGTPPSQIPSSYNFPIGE